jgi:FixJ family two-component response regulator
LSVAAPIVFVVDDDESMRTALRHLLTSAGLSVEAFATAHAFLSSPRPNGPACLVLDVRLPDLSGLDLQKHLFQEGKALPIVFLTGHGDIPMTVQAMKAGAVEFLTKPFRSRELLDAIHRALDTDRKTRWAVTEPDPPI